MQKKYNELCFHNIVKHVKWWTWQELNWGMENNIIDKRDIIDYAKEILDEQTKEFDVVLEVSISEEYEDISKYLDILVSSEDNQDDSDIEDKWRYVIIQDLYNNQTKYENVYENIETVYSDFDYPEDMVGFIRYMPSNSGCSFEESWEKYLGVARERFN